MKKIEDIINIIINKLSERDGYKKAWLEKHWIELVGKEAEKHSRPYKIENDVLFVSVDSSVWNQELFMKSAGLISKINQKSARNIVTAIKYQMGSFEGQSKLLEEESLCLNSTEDNARKVIDELWEKNILNSLKRKKQREIC